MEKKSTLLPHLDKKVVSGVRGFKLCSYLIALEGWRRGLSLKWYSNASALKVSNIKKLGNNYAGRLFSLSSEENFHYFFRSRGDLVTNEAVNIARNKEETKQFLKRNQLPVPEGQRFQADTSDEEIISFARTIDFPLVVKPTYGSLGKGVITNITDEETLRKALKRVRLELNYTDLIVEKYIPGKEYRIYIVGDQVVGAINRIPANVIGDGKKSLNKLIQSKNLEKKRNPYLSTRPIEIDDEVMSFIEMKGYTLDSIPKKDEIIFLRGKSNLFAGGDSVDATDELSPEIKTLAINALKAIPGLPHAGIDLIIDKHSENKGVILEINPTAEIALHAFPLIGKARDIPSAIIDYYFPETKEIAEEKSSMYFDYRSIMRSLAIGTTPAIEVLPALGGKIYGKKYTVSGHVQGIGYRQWVRRKALGLNLNGFAKNMKNGDVIVVVAGKEKLSVEHFKEICKVGPEKTKVSKITEEKWDYPVKVGFEIIAAESRKALDKKKIKKLEAELEKVQSELKQINAKLRKINSDKKNIEQERDHIKLQYSKIKQSRTWRYTRPLRKGIRYFKKKKS